MAFGRTVSMVLVGFALAALAPMTASAQGGPPATPDEPRFALGLGMISSPRPYVGADNELRAIPILEAYWKRFYFQGIRGGYRIVEGQRLNLDATVRWSFTRLDPDDSDFLTGMAERDATAMAGLELDWNLSRQWQLSLRADADVLGRHDGVETEAQLTWRKRLGPKLVLAPSVGATWQSSALVDHYVGVRPEEARPDRPAYEGPAAWSFTASLTGLWFVTPRWSTVATLSLQHFDDEIYDSPVVDDRWGYFALAGLTYRF